MALEQLYLETGMNKVDFAIDLLKAWEPSEGYELQFSGGKDSQVIYHLAIQSGVKFTAHYCVSPIDPPQIHKFIKDHYPNVIWDIHAKGFWKEVIKRGLPMRQQRWCCSLIKEAGGKNKTIIVGNRHSESSHRSKQCFVAIPSKAPTKKLQRLNKTIIRPILHFTDYDVWQYLNENNLPHCSLYDEGFKRIGCVLCPYSRNIKREELYFPQIVKLWKRACDTIVAKNIANNYIGRNGQPLKHRFKTGEELYKWWTSRK